MRELERELGLLNKQGNCCGFDVSLSQCHALVEIGRAKKVSLKELANIIALDISTMSRTVDNLVKKGYVVKKSSSLDRRSVEIELTNNGLLLFNDIEDSMNKNFEEVFDRISNEEKKNVINSLQIIINAFKKEECNCNKSTCYCDNK
ncbi:MarR family transcriptional regulator [Clostridium botulinum]|uniref:MarR family transcriptional regulator n=1 Tax=Clostridium botulinum TaxID=1491 RepID=UPI001968144A|nr:MarR family transcriptional regulator [Clostridium botulinum]